MGYGFTGNCAAPGDIYRHDYLRGDNRCNLIWWRAENSNTTEDGHLIGGAPNVFRSRVPPAVDAVRSVVLYPSPADSEWPRHMRYRHPALPVQGEFLSCTYPPRAGLCCHVQETVLDLVRMFSVLTHCPPLAPSPRRPHVLRPGVRGSPRRRVVDLGTCLRVAPALPPALALAPALPSPARPPPPPLAPQGGRHGHCHAQDPQEELSK